MAPSPRPASSEETESLEEDEPAEMEATREEVGTPDSLCGLSS